jgi:hypothetical protein
MVQFQQQQVQKCKATRTECFNIRPGSVSVDYFVDFSDELLLTSGVLGETPCDGLSNVTDIFIGHGEASS